MTTMWRMEGNVVLIESPRKGAQMASEPPRCRLRENAELVKLLAEEIRELADEYQRKMRVVH